MRSRGGDRESAVRVEIDRRRPGSDRGGRAHGARPVAPAPRRQRTRARERLLWLVRGFNR